VPRLARADRGPLAYRRGRPRRRRAPRPDRRMPPAATRRTSAKVTFGLVKRAPRRPRPAQGFGACPTPETPQWARPGLCATRIGMTLITSGPASRIGFRTFSALISRHRGSAKSRRDAVAEPIGPARRVHRHIHTRALPIRHASGAEPHPKRLPGAHAGHTPICPGRNGPGEQRDDGGRRAGQRPDRQALRSRVALAG
jgi:hypothetical protein